MTKGTAKVYGHHHPALLTRADRQQGWIRERSKGALELELCQSHLRSPHHAAVLSRYVSCTHIYSVTESALSQAEGVAGQVRKALGVWFGQRCTWPQRQSGHSPCLT